jgi:hypothetical protein
MEVERPAFGVEGSECPLMQSKASTKRLIELAGLKRSNSQAAYRIMDILKDPRLRTHARPEELDMLKNIELKKSLFLVFDSRFKFRIALPFSG